MSLDWGTVLSVYGFGKWLYDKGYWLYQKYRFYTSRVADYIHWDFIKKIHRIGYLCSSDYRRLWEGILNTIRNASKSMGRDADFLIHLMYTTKSLVNIGAALGGYSYDVAENRYFYFVSRWLNKVNRSADWYQTHPESLFTDFEALVIVPNQQNSTRYGDRVWAALGAVVSAAETNAVKLADLHDALSAFDRALEGNVRGWVGGMIDDAVDLLAFTDTATFDNYVVKSQKALDIIGADLIEGRGILNGLVDKLTFPGRFLADLAHLDELQKRIEESQVADVASRVLDASVAEMEDEVKPILMDLQKLSEALKKKLPPVEWAVGEVEAPVVKPIGKIDPVHTWFVGDY